MKRYRIFMAIVVMTFMYVFDSKAQWLPPGTETTDSKFRTGNIGIGTKYVFPGTLPPYRISLGGDFLNTKIALSETDSSVYGIGVAPGQVRFHVNANTSRFSFLDAPAGNEVLTIKGTGEVGIGTSTPASKLNVENGAVLFNGTIGATPISGAGTRMMWIPAKAAFRAGMVDGTHWDDANIGSNSVAFGVNAKASGMYSLASGANTIASGSGSIASGGNTTASGDYSTASGLNSTAIGTGSIAHGIGVTASGNSSIAYGGSTTASGLGSIATGAFSIAAGAFSTASGSYATANGNYSTAMGSYVTCGGTNSFVVGAGIDGTNILINNANNSLIVGFNSNVPTFFVGPSAGAGTTGNIGIGNSSPAYKLDVTGAVAMTGFKLGSSTTAGYVLTTDINGNGSWQAAGSGTGPWSLSGNNIYANNSGNVGIGNSSPLHKLEVTGTVAMTALKVGTSSTAGYVLTASDALGNAIWKAPASSNSGWTVTGNNLFSNNTGAIGINCNVIPDGYKLSVNGDVRARKIRVDSERWCDYVFAEGYRLTPLKELEQFINTYKHLPEIPSEMEVKEKGIDLADMDARLLKKVEEMTLYIIQLEKRIETLEKK